ncbi:hypothetical protein L596_010225 [Steinernema carpocapsae]|uniref:G-protein coupled receptors family 1 profile domain-containing protein n=1 Tax=Steinernema carpocapsae TaxID=34508 RepID=A0A4U5PJ05_STECR|nr:hypothetical protein L596_010225 [Steinernema carpocapsae]
MLFRHLATDAERLHELDLFAFSLTAQDLDMPLTTRKDLNDQFTFNWTTTVAVYDKFFQYGVYNAVINIIGVLTNSFLLYIGLTMKIFNTRPKVVATDRFFLFTLKKELPQLLLICLFNLPFVYIVAIITVEMQSTHIVPDLICSMSLSSTFWVENMTLFIWTFSIFTATVCSCFVLYSIFYLKAAYVTKVSKSKLEMDKRIAWSVFLQSILPALISVPMLIIIVLKELGVGLSLPVWILWVVNASVFIYFAVSPIFSVIIIKPYRIATKQILVRLIIRSGVFFGSSKVWSTVSPIRQSSETKRVAQT